MFLSICEDSSAINMDFTLSRIWNIWLKWFVVPLKRLEPELFLDYWKRLGTH